MRQRRWWFGWLVVGVMACTAAPALARERWVHVRVEDARRGGETLRVDVPLSWVEDLLPRIAGEHLRGGKIHLGDDACDGIDLRAVWQAIREGREGDLATVRGTDGRVRVHTEAGELRIHVEEFTGDPSRIEARIPLGALDALFGGAAGELDVAAFVRALADRGASELVRVRGGSSNVRIWIDSTRGNGP